MTSNIVNTAANGIAKLISEEVKSLYHVKDKVEMLRSELRMILDYLHDAEEKQHNSFSIRNSLSKLRDLAYEAEDLVQKYCLEVPHKRRLGILGSAKWFCSLPASGLKHHEVAAEFDILIEKINRVFKQLQDYDVVKRIMPDGSRSTIRLPRNAYPHTLAKEPVGLKEDTGILVNRLVHTTTNSIIISGMSGIGKSTLAKKVYEERDLLQGRFDYFVWIYVSKSFQPSCVWRTILYSLCPDGYGEFKGRQISTILDDLLLSELVSKALQDYKCLVVLDDLCSVEGWRSLEPGFSSIGKSLASHSKLLITSCIKDLVKEVGPNGLLHEMKCLDETQSESLLSNVLAENGYFFGDKELDKLLRLKLWSCNGLPLAIRAFVENLMKSTSSWRVALHQNLIDGWYNDRDGTVSQALKLSYSDLPYYLKPCFLYLAHFPEGFYIPVEKLYHLWEAEGFLESSSGDTSAGRPSRKNIARGYLNELVNRCLVQVGEITRGGKLKTCHLQNMVREMCLSEARGENFFLVLTRENIRGNWNRISSNRVAVYNKIEGDDAYFLLETWLNHNYTISLTAGDPKESEVTHSILLEPIIKYTPRLRILDLRGPHIDVLPKEIGELIYLRYLSLKGSNIRKVPSSIGSLRGLLIFDLRVSENEPYGGLLLPNEIWKMRRLKHLYFPLTFRCVGNRFIKLSGLTHLETLMNLDPRICQMEDLRELKNIKKLSVTERYFFDHVKSLRCLRFLTDRLVKQMILGIEAQVLHQDSTILIPSSDSDGSFNLALHQLKIYGYVSPTIVVSFPEIFPSNLAYLVLEMSALMSDPMPILEKLPSLRCLCLLQCLEKGVKRMVCSAEGFPRLTTLMLCLLYHVEEWKVEVGAMPSLDELWMDNCPHLEKKGIPHELSTPGRAILSNDYGAFMKSNGGFRRSQTRLCSGMGWTSRTIASLGNNQIHQESKKLLNHAHSDSEPKEVFLLILAVPVTPLASIYSSCYVSKEVFSIFIV